MFHVLIFRSVCIIVCQALSYVSARLVKTEAFYNHGLLRNLCYYLYVKFIFHSSSRSSKFIPSTILWAIRAETVIAPKSLNELLWLRVTLNLILLINSAYPHISSGVGILSRATAYLNFLFVRTYNLLVVVFVDSVGFAVLDF